MSRTYEIACKTCKETLWIGQGWPPAEGAEDQRNIYTGMPDVMDKLTRFLFKHETKPESGLHELVFGDDEPLDFASFHDFESEPGECVCDRCNEAGAR
jgi:hypothetical protein